MPSSEKQPTMAGGMDLPISTTPRSHSTPWRTIALTALTTLAITRFPTSLPKLPTLFPAREHKDVSRFNWVPCFDTADSPQFLCGRLSVPLDYTNASDPRRVSLAMTKYVADPSSKMKSERTLVVNPGGPGGSGTSLVYRKGEFFNKNLTNGLYDVVGWDPRGVNLTEPYLSCFPHDAYRDRWSLATQQWPETGGFSHLVMVDAMNEATMRACSEQWGDIPRFLSTAFVARDMDAIREALEEDELTAMLISYGTGIGQTYTQLFPDKVGRIVMDGLEYAKDGRLPWGWGTTSLDNVTAAWEDGFLGECVTAGGDRCALVEGEQDTKEGLINRMAKLFSKVLDRPIPANSPMGPGIITYEALIGLIYQALYRPESWPKTARGLAELENGNGTMVLEAVQRMFGFNPEKTEKQKKAEETYPLKFPKFGSAELSAMVICGDSYDAPKMPLEWYAELQVNMTEKSFISGNSRLLAPLPCRHFNYTEAEVYRGDFDASLKAPVLLIGETYDPATPLRNGRKLAKEMGRNARLIVHHGYGHASSDRSKCTDGLVRALYLNGSLPKELESDCYADNKPYPENGEDDNKFKMEEFATLTIV